MLPHDHAQFHKEMIEAVRQDLSSEEMQKLIQALTKLDVWFRAKEKENLTDA